MTCYRHQSVVTSDSYGTTEVTDVGDDVRITVQTGSNPAFGSIVIIGNASDTPKRLKMKIDILAYLTTAGGTSSEVAIQRVDYNAGGNPANISGAVDKENIDSVTDGVGFFSVPDDTYPDIPTPGTCACHSLEIDQVVNGDAGTAVAQIKKLTTPSTPALLLTGERINYVVVLSDIEIVDEDINRFQDARLDSLLSRLMALEDAQHSEAHVHVGHKHSDDDELPPTPIKP